MMARVPERPVVIRGGLVADAESWLGAADILVEDGLIVEIGPPGMAALEGAESIDARRMLIHPGLVNAHTHGHGNLGKSMGDRWTLELLLAGGGHIANYRAAFEKHISALIGAAEMVLKGCTACYDLFVELPGPTPDGMEAVARAYETAGMRAVIAPMLADLTLYEAVPGLRDALPDDVRPSVDAMRMPAWEETIATTAAIVRGWSFDRDRIRPAIAPTIPLHCRDPFLEACRDLAEAEGLGLHSHIAESKVQAVAGQRCYGRSLLAHMDALGLVGPRFTAAHGVWLDGDDMRILGERGASMAHNPASNMRLGNGMADMAGLLAHGVNVGIGTDAATCSDNLNMYAGMHLAALTSHVSGPDPTRWVTAPEVFAAATIGSARALGFERIGRIAPGFCADLVFLDLDRPTLTPLHNPIPQLVLGEDGTSVAHVMIDGRFVVRDRTLLTVDLSALSARAAELRAELDERGAGARALFDAVAPVVADFCPALAATPWPLHRYCGCPPERAAFAANAVPETLS
jgi:5-methylthioadenosine/S-adenosylhomocysteine deaminase